MKKISHLQQQPTTSQIFVEETILAHHRIMNLDASLDSFDERM
jgi:hypothetical protein